MELLGSLVVGAVVLVLVLVLSWKRSFLGRWLKISWQKFMLSMTFGSKSSMGVALMGGLGTRLMNEAKNEEEELGDELFDEALRRFKVHCEKIARETDLETEISQLPSADPRKQASLKNFQPLVQGTHCLFAKRAKLWGSSPWDPKRSIEENVLQDIEALKLFTSKAAKGWHLDGFVWEIPPWTRSAAVSTTSTTSEPMGDLEANEGYDISTIEGFGEVLRRVLHCINSKDPHPVSQKCLSSSVIASSRIARPGWFFEFMSESYFITTFAPFYPSEGHARYGFGSPSAWILFQPEFAFSWHRIGNDTPETNWEHPKTMRDKIRVEFRDHGRGYEIPPTVRYSPAIDYIKPLKHSDPVVQWWIPHPRHEHHSSGLGASYAPSAPGPASKDEEQTQ